MLRSRKIGEKMRTATGLVFASLLGVQLASQSSLAQEATGTIRGSLLDPNGSVVTGLDTPIHLTHLDSGTEYMADVKREGQYEVRGLPAGEYRVSFPSSCCMYQTFTSEGVVIASGETLHYDLNLQWHINLGTIGDDPGMLSNDMRAEAGDVSGPTPRMPDGTPDLSGIWYNVPLTAAQPQPSLQPWAAEIERQLREIGADPNAGAYCLPQSAVPTTLIFPYKFVQTPDLIVQITEFVTPAYRQIFLDGREHPDLWNPSWYGHSVGHWEGDTLVVETVGFNEITPGFGIHSERLRIVERYTRTRYGVLEIEITAEDPEAYTEPYTIYREAGIAAADQEILEFVCNENNNRQMNVGGVPWRGRP
jgi:Carboxypeptidase regulatory-like domain